MKIIRLKNNPSIYTGNSYLVLGEWNKLDDVNSLVDTGTDGYIISEIKRINTGVGKKAVDRIVLTHNHFDHTGGLAKLIDFHKAEVFAHTAGAFVNRLLCDGEIIRLGDSYFEVIHTPGHSSDSICLYNKNDGILFSGDTQIRINTCDGSYTKDYLESIERLANLDIKIVYPGHGEALSDDPNGVIARTLENIKASTVF